MQSFGLIGELVKEVKNPFGINKLSFDRLDTTTLFADVLAARAEEVVQAKDSQPEKPEPLQREWDRGPAETIREQVADVCEKPDDILLAPEKAPVVGKLLEQLGFEKDEIKEALGKAKAEAKDGAGGLKLGEILQAIKKHGKDEAQHTDTSLPPGLAPQILVMAEKMGMSKTKLEKLAQVLGSGSVSLKRLVAILKELGSGHKHLRGSDLAGVREILEKAGLTGNEAEKLILKHVDPEGGLSMEGLITTLEDVIRTKDKTDMLVRSGRLPEIMKSLLEGARIPDGQKPEETLNAESMAHHLKRLEADKKIQAAGKKQGRKNLVQTVLAKDEKPEGVEQAKLKDLESLLVKHMKNDKSEIAGESKTGPRHTFKVGPDSAGLQTSSPEKTSDRMETRTGRVVKAAAGKAGAADVTRTRTAGPQRGLDRIDLSAAKGVRTGGVRTSAQAGKAAPPRMSPSVLLEQLSGRMMMMVKSNQPSLRLQLFPPELGSLRIDLKVDGASVKATIIAENRQVQQMLGANSSELRQSLADQGLNLDKFEVMTQGQYQQADAHGRETREGNRFSRSDVQGGVGEETQVNEDSRVLQTRYAGSGRLDLMA